jgi:hypothetical protein
MRSIATLAALAVFLPATAFAQSIKQTEVTNFPEVRLAEAAG